ncbi:small multi-drug export protein [Bacillus sp. H-16]|uniref:small multi-drug export protein n=1 Tax=Alteribacter salitolerans TaxID=2912333 RepID=UPI0019652C0A|nr:small multi-drug export protein [Alteribacter salitolerans]MBM7095293.1 small multi-drug export protein [Alteribacter salitolerans]
MMFDLLWQYILVFLMAALPWLEILFVIPIGIGMGLNPFGVGIVSFAGNFIPVVLIVYLLKWFQTTRLYTNWKSRREEKKAVKLAAQTEQDEEKLMKKQRRAARAHRVFEKYGLPGLALLGPLLTGIHLAAVIALSLKANKHATTVWMGASLAAWTVFLTIAAYYGFDFIL